MLFLVEISVKLPSELLEESERRTSLLARELERGVELRRSGTIQRIWRIPGRQRNVGIWEAEDATALHEALSSLPLFPWISATVTPLATHPVEREVEG
jgi:muconolactone delta-isomerase